MSSAATRGSVELSKKWHPESTYGREVIVERMTVAFGHKRDDKKEFAAAKALVSAFVDACD